MSDHEMVEEQTTYCEIHPDRETGLRCNRCNRYMCWECAVQTPVGYRCKQCVRQVEDRFFTAREADLMIVFTVCAVLGAIAGAVMSAVGFLIIAIFLGLPAGGLIAEAALRATQRRRGRYNAITGAAGIAIGSLIGAAIRLALVYNDRFGEITRIAQERGIALPDQIPGMGDFVIQNIGNDLSLIIFIGVATFAVYSRYRI